MKTQHLREQKKMIPVASGTSGRASVCLHPRNLAEFQEAMDENAKPGVPRLLFMLFEDAAGLFERFEKLHDNEILSSSVRPFRKISCLHHNRCRTRICGPCPQHHQCTSPQPQENSAES